MKLTLRTATDTATPRPSIPIFLIHSIEAPFCNQAGCWCQSSKARSTLLLAAIGSGDLHLREAGALIDSPMQGGQE